MTARAGRLIRLDDSHRILSYEESLALAQRIYSFAKGDSETRVQISIWWQGELRWARNRVSLASDRRDIEVNVTRAVKGPVALGSGSANTNQLDDVSLESAVRAAERVADISGTLPPPVLYPPVPTWKAVPRAVWSDTTYNLTAAERGETARSIIRHVEGKEMVAAGYIEVRAGSFVEMSSLRTPGEYAHWDHPYSAWTQAQCSMTVRDPKGTGSGWAGISSYDWGSINSASLAERAIEKCVASRNPVALEPGRYTVVLEPQAVADLLAVLVSAFARDVAEGGQMSSPFWFRAYQSKLGLKVVDDRVTISHDPTDPRLGVIAQPGMDQGPVTWIDRGVLTNLAYDRGYALERLNAPYGTRGLTGYRMSGGDTTIDEMIRTTKRGLLVTRLSNIRKLDPISLLSTGLTRDGLWLIENGTISKAVKNFRFTESPLFVLNSVEQLGPPVPVFRPETAAYEPRLMPAIVPPLKVRDFSFTSMIDAV